MAHGLEPTPEGGERQPFIVSPDGETTGEIAHLQQVGLEFAQLSPADPLLEIDARKVAGQEIQVLFLDFGMPPRVLTISGDFKTEYEVGNSDYAKENESSPNTLNLSCPAYGWRSTNSATTHYQLDGINAEYSVPLRRGRFIAVSHYGPRSDERNGFLDNNTEIVLADDYPDGNSIKESSANLLGVGYDGHNISLIAQDYGNALVIYGKSIGFADRRDDSETVDPAELEAILKKISTPEEAENTVRGLYGSLGSLVAKHAFTVSQMETLEAMLAHNRDLLANARRENRTLQYELRRAKESPKDGGATENDDWLRQAFGGNRQSSSNAAEACKILGLDPSILELDPSIVGNLVSMSRKAWAKTLHSDVTGSKEAEEKLKAVNNAADILDAQYK